jgi:aminodeoxyfutalosine deaminase
VMELDPTLTQAEVLERYRYKDFLGFLDSFKWVNLFLNKPEDYALITHRLLQDLQAQGVVYAEIIVSVGVMLWRKQPFDPIFAAIAEAAAQGPIPVQFTFDATRQFGVDAAWKVAECAVKSKHLGVMGFGLGGDEARGPAEDYAEVFAYAKQHGLHLLPHAGETVGPESVWQALEVGAERIGHGIRAIEDPELMKHLREKDIPLEVSITSNVCTGAVMSLDTHPVRKLWDAGVPIILNTDDPPMFHTNLVREYKIAADTFGFTKDELEIAAKRSLHYSFRDELPEAAAGSV